jgi:ABC-type antimicrobial peptide transport system permease subunit
LLALLIGGIGIVNTMQVVLRRRHTEIAMLKTVGYRRGDLILLFGLETGVLGLLGGIVGAGAGIGVSFLVKGLMESAITLALPVTIDPVTVLSGVAIGFFTALIFGLLPIVQASQIRPVSVLRGFGEGRRRGNSLVVAVLGIVLIALFFLLALSILQNVELAVAVVAGGSVFLLLLTLGFTLVTFLIGKLAVPDGLSWGYTLVEIPTLALSILLIVKVPIIGILFLMATVLSILIVLLPRTARANMTMALHNIGRRKVRSATTLVALFVGVFAIGLILTLGQNLEQGISSTASNYTGGYNTFIQASSSDKPAVERELANIRGIQAETVISLAGTQPLVINGVAISQFLVSLSPAERQTAISDLSTVVGYDLAQGQYPPEPLIKGNQDDRVGRALAKQDAGSTHVVVAQDFAEAPFDLKLGDSVTLAGVDGKSAKTLTIVGFFKPSTTFGSLSHFIEGDESLTTSLTSGHPIYLYSLILSPRQAGTALQSIQRAIPSVSVISLAQELNFYLGLLNNLVTMLTAVASLALLAGLIIIANAVTLSMLERRRELGIFKSVGYTSASILEEVLMENGAIGLFGALLAMLLATLVATILASFAFHVTLGTNLALMLIVVFGTAVLCMLVSGVVAWSATRMRPLEVLRYE